MLEQNGARIVFLALGGLALIAAGLLYLRMSATLPVAAAGQRGTVYSLHATDLKGQRIQLADYRGQVTLFVNVASECGLASQFSHLETLHHTYRPQGFTVLAFPSNDFWQEPGDAASIERTCEFHRVTFPVFAKVSVRPGPGQSPVYAHLTGTGHVPAWNFAKYLVGRDGTVRAFFGPLVSPDSPQLTSAIDRALAEPRPQD